METPQTGYRTSCYGIPTKRYCQTLDLKENPELIAQYRCLHDQEHAWREIIEGIRSVGILEMEIYIRGNRLFMIIETPEDFCWETAMKKLSGLPRQAEWEALTARFQKALPTASSSENWQLMERIFHLYP